MARVRLLQMRPQVRDALWLLLLAFFVWAGVRHVPLHGDEPTQIFMTRDFYYQAQGDWEQVRYQAWDQLSPQAATEQDLRLLNGTLPKYIFGATAYLSGYTLSDLNDQWVWGAGWQWNHENGHVPQADLLVRLRTVSVLMFSLSVVVLFGIGMLIDGRLVAYIATAYYALNPALLINGRRVMMESAMLLFSLAVVAVGLLVLRQRKVWLFVLLGLVSGLAVASKHTSVVTVIAVFAAITGYSLYQRDHWRVMLGGLVLAGGLSLAVFYSLNPAWWHDPLTRAPDLLERRTELLSGQVDAFGGYETFGAQVAGFIRQALIVQPMYAEVPIDGFITAQADRIAQYDQAWYRGISIGGSVSGAIALTGLVLGGVYHLWRAPYQPADRVLVLAWALAMLLLTLVVTPLEWQRYYLPMYPAIALLGALGVRALGRMLEREQTR